MNFELHCLTWLIVFVYSGQVCCYSCNPQGGGEWVFIFPFCTLNYTVCSIYWNVHQLSERRRESWGKVVRTCVVVLLGQLHMGLSRIGGEDRTWGVSALLQSAAQLAGRGVHSLGKNSQDCRTLCNVFYPEMAVVVNHISHKSFLLPKWLFIGFWSDNALHIVWAAIVMVVSF